METQSLKKYKKKGTFEIKIDSDFMKIKIYLQSFREKL